MLPNHEIKLKTKKKKIALLTIVTYKGNNHAYVTFLPDSSLVIALEQHFVSAMCH